MSIFSKLRKYILTNSPFVNTPLNALSSFVLIVYHLFKMKDMKSSLNFLSKLLHVGVKKYFIELSRQQAIAIYQKITSQCISTLYNLKISYVRET